MNITLNGKTAKKLGLLSGKDISITKDTDLIYKPISGIIYNSVEFEKLENKSGYYKIIKETDESYTRFKELYWLHKTVVNTRIKLKDLEESYEQNIEDLEGIILSTMSTKFVVFHNRPVGYDMNPKSIELKNNSKLLDFGRRYDGLWISIIETPKLISKGDYHKQFTTTDIHEVPYSGGDIVNKMEATNYKSGERFLRTCDNVKVMGGIEIKQDIPQS